MATDGPTPQRCDREIFEKGAPIAAFTGSSNAIENWVKSVASKANSRIDWHYSGGIAQVLHLGDEESRMRTIEAMIDLLPTLNGQLVAGFDPTDPGLYRAGITEAPAGAIAAFFEDGEPSSGYLVAIDHSNDTPPAEQERQA